MFYQILLSPQVKWCGIISYKHGIYKLRHVLPSDLRLTSQEIREYQGSVQTQQNDSPAPRPPARIKIPPILPKNRWKTEIKRFPYCTASHKNRS